jgi:hypothetical protein
VGPKELAVRRGDTTCSVAVIRDILDTFCTLCPATDRAAGPSQSLGIDDGYGYAGG